MLCSVAVTSKSDSTGLNEAGNRGDVFINTCFGRVGLPGNVLNSHKKASVRSI